MKRKLLFVALLLGFILLSRNVFAAKYLFFPRSSNGPMYMEIGNTHVIQYFPQIHGRQCFMRNTRSYKFLSSPRITKMNTIQNGITTTYQFRDSDGETNHIRLYSEEKSVLLQRLKGLYLRDFDNIMELANHDVKNIRFILDVKDNLSGVAIKVVKFDWEKYPLAK
ncbi:MAG: hypothetical protein LBV16_04660 [Elusimicrobiota bacterium]|jgi:hypothetical protein|nr:hypothetical protein [Elusimicrobiota bacterium]